MSDLLSSADIRREIDKLPENTRLECENLMRDMEAIYTGMSFASKFYATTYWALKLGEDSLKKVK